MMKRSIFGKLLAIAMVFAGFSLTSCDESDNPSTDGKIWVKPEVTLTEGGATITANTPSDISRMFNRIKQEMINAAKKGEKFTIDIEGPVLDVTGSDNTISILTVTGSDLVVNFKSAITADTPLTIESKGVADDAGPTTSTNKVEINVPSASDIDLEINMPTTTVTLNAASGSLNIDELIAQTAFNTLIIGKGVTVNWLQLKGGTAVVKEGGKVLGAVWAYPWQSIEVYKSGIRLGLYNEEIPEEEPTDDDFYWLYKVKVINDVNWDKWFIGKPIDIIAQPSEDEQKNEIEIIISDGAKARVDFWGNPKDVPVFNITGEGDATIMCQGNLDDNKKAHGQNYINLSFVNMLSNVTVDLSNLVVWNDETGEYEVVERDEEDYSEITLPINSENCTFKAKRFFGTTYTLSEDIVLSTHKGSKFDNLENENEDLFTVCFPEQSKNRKTFNFSFDSCEFEQAGFITEFSGEDEKFDGFKAYMTFENSKVGGKAITKNTEMITNVETRSYEEKPVTSTFFVIDGVTYKPVHVDEPEDQWTLLPVE